MKGSLSPLIGKKVSLQAFTESDITDEYIAWLNDPEVVRFSNQRFVQHTLSSCKQYLSTFKGNENLFLAVKMKESDTMVGTMTAYISVPHRTADMGILIGNRRYWGQGVGLDAWSTLMDHLFAAHEIRKVTGGTLRCNIGMIKIMERSGMHCEAVRARQELVEGEAQDALYFARFKGD